MLYSLGSVSMIENISKVVKSFEFCLAVNVTYAQENNLLTAQENNLLTVLKLY